MSVMQQIESARPRVKNIKIRFQVLDTAKLAISIQNIINSQLDESAVDNELITRKNNMVIYRGKFVYIIFPKTGVINATKIPNDFQIYDCIEEFKSRFGVDFDPEKSGPLIIDNYQSVGALRRGVNLHRLKSYMYNNLPKVLVRFNPDFFPAVYVKFPGHGLLMIFATGKYNIVGAKNHTDTSKIFRSALHLLYMFDNYKADALNNLLSEAQLKLLRNMSDIMEISKLIQCMARDGERVTKYMHNLLEGEEKPLKSENAL
jgi:TATA-box binding protein (TBP) (component of TFIID and TFIIIB)